MKISKIGQAQIIMSNPLSIHNYFAWPSVARLQNGKIAVTASGFRLRHVCPFGKAVISFSEDEGRTYTLPSPVIDTVLDDRDCGIVPFGKSSVIVTSFNNTTAFQRENDENTDYDTAYLDTVSPEKEKEFLGSNFRISHDCAVTFGNLFRSPVTSPHGPAEMPDGSLIWVGSVYNHSSSPDEPYIKAYKINPDGSYEYLGSIDNIKIDGITPCSCEPYAVALDDGTLIAHIRMENSNPGIFTLYQSESRDNGRSWSVPRQLLPLNEGAPAHILKHSSGTLICTYGHRESPCSIRAMFSSDNGKSWDTGYDIYVNGADEGDLGYPASVELEDSSVLTVFYAHEKKDSPAVIMQQKWKFEKD